ncbi:DUF7946 domain-containing protein [Methylorubrum extorquens]
MELIAKFDGAIAERNVLPAFEGAQSLEGIARSITLVSHFIVTSQVRKKYPFDRNVLIVMEPPRKGSFEAIFSFVTDKDTVLTTTALGSLGVSLFGDVLKDTLTLIVKRLVGKDHTPKTDQLGRMLAADAGNIEALGEAVEPALKKAHIVINNGAGNITIISGSNNVVTFDGNSKRYLNTTVIVEQPSHKLVSCGMLNANTRNGRIFDQELGRTVPIRVPKGANPRTLGALAESLQRYS